MNSLDKFLNKKPTGGLGREEPTVAPLNETASEVSLVPVEPVADTEDVSRSSEIPTITPEIEVKRGLQPDEPPKKSWFSKKTKAKVDSASDELSAKPLAKKEKKPKQSNPIFSIKKEKKDSGLSISSLFLVTDVDGGRQLHWEVTSAGISQQERATPETQYVSFSRYDFAYVTDEPLSKRDANDFVLAELAEDAGVINDSKLGYIYATTNARIIESALKLASGIQLFNRAVANKETDPNNSVIISRLEGADNVSLTIVYYRAIDGSISAPQLAVNADNLDFIIRQFSSTRKVPETAKTVYLTAADLLSAAKGLVDYPKEGDFLGLSISKSKNIALLASLIIAGFMAINAVKVQLEVMGLQDNKARLDSDISRIKKEVSNGIEGSLDSFAASQSINLSTVTSRASEIWTPYSRVVVDAHVGQESYKVTLPISPDSAAAGKSLLLRNLLNEDISNFLSKQPPNECSKTSLGISGAIDAIQFEITCQSPDRPIYRYRID